MNELNKDQVQALMGYMDARIEKLKQRRERYIKEGDIVSSMHIAAQSAKIEYVQAFLEGLMHGEN